MPKKAESKKESGRLDAFFDHLGNKAEGTLSGYRTNIWLFLKYALKLDTNAKKADLGKYVDQYFNNPHDVCEDFRQYLKAHISNRPALSAKQSYNTLKVFFETVTDVSFSPKQIKALKNQLPKGSDAASEETDFTQEDIRAILQHTDIKMKAIILTLATGGMRISDLLEMSISDVKFDTAPVQVVVGNKKTNAKPRISFITSEAMQAIREWLKVRDAYLASTATTALNFKDKAIKVKGKTDLLFPLSEQSINQAFKDAIIATFGSNDTDALTGRSKRHIHGLRKFCSSQLGSAGNNQGIVDKIIGHKTALSKAYDRYPVKDLADAYLKAEPKLMIEAPPELINDAIKNNDRIEVIRDQQGTAQALINRLQLDKAELEDQVKALQDKEQERDAAIAALQQAVSSLLQQSRADRITDFTGEIKTE